MTQVQFNLYQPTSQSFLDQFVPPPNLAPPTHPTKLQQTHPPRRPARIPNDDRLPLILWATENIRAEPLTRDYLHFAEPPQHPDQQDCQHQQNSGDHRRSRLRPQTAFDDPAASRGRGGDEVRERLRDGERGSHARKAGKVGRLPADLLGHSTPRSARHAGLKVRSIIGLHDDAMTFRNG